MSISPLFLKTDIRKKLFQIETLHNILSGAMSAPPHPDVTNVSYSKLSDSNYMNNLMELVKQNYHGTAKGRFISKLETIFCVFLPLKGVLKRAAENSFVNALIPFIGVRKRQVIV
jgi:hypothetical protein